MTTAEREQQRTDALALANYVRIANANLRRELAFLSHRDGCERVAALLLEPSGPVLSFPIGRLLTCIDRIGESGMTRYLRAADIFSTTKRVSALTQRQREALARVLRDRHSVFPTAMAA